MAFCNGCGAQLEGNERFCKKCGSDVTAKAAAPAAPAAPAPAAYPQAAAAAPPAYGQAPPAHGAYPPQPYAPQQGAPPGMVAMLYQAYPGGPQQVYYVPAQGKHASAGAGVLEGLQSKIRALASTDKLEGFSFKELFKETFAKRGPEEMTDYLMVGSSRTTPPLELVDTNWPKPWFFFRVVVAMALGAVALWLVWHFTFQPNTIPAMLFLGAFAVPITVAVFVFEMNTPRNVPIVLVLELIVLGGILTVGLTLLEYQITIIADLPGIVEEVGKLLVAILVARALRFRYQLNGILFGCAVGAGYAGFETCSYALGFLGNPAFCLGTSGFMAPSVILEMTKAINDGLSAIQANSQPALQQAASEWNAAMNDALGAMVSVLKFRGLLSPFCHPVWTGIAAGAFWRVKQDRPANFSMALDPRFLRAFLIPVLLHSVWDLGVTFPSLFQTNSQTTANELGYMMDGIDIAVAFIGWYVLFTMIQQGLHQVRDMQKAQLQSTLSTVEATLGLGTRRPPMPMAPAGMAVSR